MLDRLAVWREIAYSDGCEWAALAWAESVTLVPQTGVLDAVFGATRRHFTEKEVVGLTPVVAVKNARNRIAIRFRRGRRHACGTRPGNEFGGVGSEGYSG
jgi:alkylhydroperoxidase family enzyme